MSTRCWRMDEWATVEVGPTPRKLIRSMLAKVPATATNRSRMASLVLDRQLPRNEPLDVADHELSDRVIKALDASTADFRTISSLADELAASNDAVKRELDHLGQKVRRPLGQEYRYPDWYRLTQRGPTRQERLGRLKAILGFTAMDDDF